MEVVNALMRNTIDLTRAELILRALHIAVKNARRVKFAASATSMIKEIPTYSAPNVGTTAPDSPGRNGAAEESEPDLPYSAAIAPTPARETAAEIKRAAKVQAERDRQAAIRAHLVRAAKGVCYGPSTPPAPADAVPPNVVTAAPNCPSGPEVSTRTAVPR